MVLQKGSEVINPAKPIIPCPYINGFINPSICGTFECEKVPCGHRDVMNEKSLFYCETILTTINLNACKIIDCKHPECKFGKNATTEADVSAMPISYMCKDETQFNQFQKDINNRLHAINISIVGWIRKFDDKDKSKRRETASIAFAIDSVYDDMVAEMMEKYGEDDFFGPLISDMDVEKYKLGNLFDKAVDLRHNMTGAIYQISSYMDGLMKIIIDTKTEISTMTYDQYKKGKF
jgi:hypothetical protein